MNRPVERIVRFFDWRFFTSVAAFGLVVLLLVSISSADSSRRRASLRITTLQQDLQSARSENADLREKIGQNTDAIDALGEQIRQLGGTPVVTQAQRPTSTGSENRTTGSSVSHANSAPGTTTPGRSTTTTTRPRSTTTTTRPGSTTTTTRRTCVAGLCI